MVLLLYIFCTDCTAYLILLIGCNLCGSDNGNRCGVGDGGCVQRHPQIVFYMRLKSWREDYRMLCGSSGNLMRKLTLLLGKIGRGTMELFLFNIQAC